MRNRFVFFGPHEKICSILEKLEVTSAGIMVLPFLCDFISIVGGILNERRPRAKRGGDRYPAVRGLIF